jgi:transposase
VWLVANSIIHKGFLFLFSLSEFLCFQKVHKILYTLDKGKKNRLWSGEFKLKVVLDIIENELSYSQAARKYDMYLSSGTLNDTLPARWVYQYRLYGKERFFQTPKDYRKNPIRQFHKPSKEVEENLELKVKHLEMELEYVKKLTALVQKQEQTNKNIK